MDRLNKRLSKVLTVFLVVSTGFGDDKLYGVGYGCCLMYPASRIVFKPINREYTSIFDYMLLLRKLRYVSCKCIVTLDHRYVYTKRILNSTIIANVEVCFALGEMCN